MIGVGFDSIDIPIEVADRTKCVGCNIMTPIHINNAWVCQNAFTCEETFKFIMEVENDLQRR